MFESVELGRAISKKNYERGLPELRARMLQAEFSLKEARLPVIIIIAGLDGAGKGELVHRLNEWFDPRSLDTHAFWHEKEEEREHPFYWHFWQALPTRGRIALLLGAWYTQPIVQRVYGKIDNAELDAALQRIAFFEQTLAHDNTLIIKLWLHLSARSLSQRLKDLNKDRNTHWRVLPTDWAHQKRYGKFMKVSERVVRETDLDKAPWHLIEATDPRYRDMTAARIIVEAIEKRLEQCSRNKFIQHGPPPKIKVTESGEKTILDKIDLTLSLPRDRYEHKLAKYQARLNKILWAAHEKRIANVMVFEGWDASGKGNCIRRVTAAMDPRLFRVVPICAPSDEERAHHYLWRFWRQLPADGMVTIFDRSWYGRVLVERVEGFATSNEWMNAYREINVFEEHLEEHGTMLTKFWIHISKEEQLRRFREREAVSFKRHKITREDWRNRGKWDEYKAAINDMIAHTSTEFAPWVLVAGEDKKYARVQIVKTLCEKLERVV